MVNLGDRLPPDSFYFIAIGNNPMVGASVAVAVAVEKAMKA